MGLLGALLLAGGALLLGDALLNSSGDEPTEEELQEIEEYLKWIGELDLDIKKKKAEFLKYNEGYKGCFLEISEAIKEYNQKLLYEQKSLEMLRLKSYERSIKEAVKVLRKVKNIRFDESREIDVKAALKTYKLQIHNAKVLLKIARKHEEMYGYTLFESLHNKFIMERLNIKAVRTNYEFQNYEKNWQLVPKDAIKAGSIIEIDGENVGELGREEAQQIAKIQECYKEYSTYYTDNFNKCKTSTKACENMIDIQKRILAELDEEIQLYSDILKRAEKIRNYYTSSHNKKKIENYIDKLCASTSLVGSMTKSENQVKSSFQVKYESLKRIIKRKKKAGVLSRKIDYEKLSKDEQKCVYDFWESTEVTVTMLNTPVITANGEFNFNKNAKFFEEFQDEKKKLRKQFGEYVKLDSADWRMLFWAISVQTMIFCCNNNYVTAINKNERLTHQEGDKKVQDRIKKLQKKYGEDKGFIKAPVPYDAITGSKELGLNLGGKNHRHRTLGHDPVWGWLYGTLNILTDTCSVPQGKEIKTYRIATGNVFTKERLDVLQLWQEALEVIVKEPRMLYLALAKQCLHFKSDENTKQGLPVSRLVGTITFTDVEVLYKNNYDNKCAMDNFRKGNVTTLFSEMGNCIISLVRDKNYDQNRDGERKYYDVKTDKILDISRAYAVAGRAVKDMINKELKQDALSEELQMIMCIRKITTDVFLQERMKKEFVEEQIQKRAQELLGL